MVRAWTGYDDLQRVRSDLLGRIYRALNEAGIEIPFPQQDLHLRSLSDDVARRLRGAGGGEDPPPA